MGVTIVLLQGDIMKIIVLFLTTLLTISAAQPPHGMPMTHRTPRQATCGLYQKGYSIFLEQDIEIEISDQIMALSNHLKLQDEDNKQNQHIVQIIDSTIKSHFPDGAAVLFGSRFKYSDVDIKLEIGSDTFLSKQNNTQIQEDIITSIEKHSEFGAQPEAIWQTTDIFSVIKIVHKPTGILCDLMYQDPRGVMNSRFIRLCQEIDPRVNSLSYVIKFWAKYHDLAGSASVHEGKSDRNRKISNLAIYNLVIFFLQNEKILPSVKKLHEVTSDLDSCILNGLEMGVPDNISVWKTQIRDTTGNNKTLSELLHHFFQYYANFDYENYVISPYNGFPVKKDVVGVNELLQTDRRNRTLLQQCRGTLVVQEAIGQSNCVTERYESNAWRDYCNIASKITKKWLLSNTNEARRKNSIWQIFQDVSLESNLSSTRKRKHKQDMNDRLKEILLQMKENMYLRTELPPIPQMSKSCNLT